MEEMVKKENIIQHTEMWGRVLKKKMKKNRKVTGKDEIQIELIIKDLKREGKEKLIKLCNEIYEEGKWLEDFK